MKETYDLIVQVHIEKKIAGQYSGERISTTVETRGIKASSFLEVCEILARRKWKRSIMAVLTTVRRGRDI